MKGKKVLLAAISAATIAAATLSGCNLLFRKVDSYPPVSSYTAETEVNAQTLMAARTKIRGFNISIDTQYYQTMGWISRTAGTGMGSGVIFEADAEYYYALTNNHVITDTVNGIRYNVKYTVTDIYSNEYSGTVVCTDASKDIAIIRFAKGRTLSIANTVARADTNLVVGEFVLAVGNPSGVNNIVTFGQIKGWKNIGNVSYSVINHNALINPGNSGGALCDIDGNLLGLNTWGTENKDDDNYTIPLSIVNNYIDQFRLSYTQAA